MRLKDYTDLLRHAAEMASDFQSFYNNARWIVAMRGVTMPNQTQMDFIWGKVKGLPVTDGRQRSAVTIGMGI